VRSLVVGALAEAAPCGAATGTDARTVDRVVGRLLHEPMRRLREAAADGNGAQRAVLVRSLLHLDDDLAGLKAAASAASSQTIVSSDQPGAEAHLRCL
jgi:hypothetical protein